MSTQEKPAGGRYSSIIAKRKQLPTSSSWETVTGGSVKTGTTLAKKRRIDDSAKLVKDVASFYNSTELSDFLIKAGSKDIYCHKFILSSRSAVFQRMFRNKMVENLESSMTISDFDPCIVESMVKYMYSAEVDNLEEEADRLLVAADKYDLEELKELCEVTLTQNLNLENAVDLLLHADIYNAKMLKEAALKFVKDNASSIAQKPECIEGLKKFPSVLADLFIATNSPSKVGDDSASKQ